MLLRASFISATLLLSTSAAAQCVGPGAVPLWSFPPADGGVVPENSHIFVNAPEFGFRRRALLDGVELTLLDAGTPALEYLPPALEVGSAHQVEFDTYESDIPSLSDGGIPPLNVLTIGFTVSPASSAAPPPAARITTDTLVSPQSDLPRSCTGLRSSPCFDTGQHPIQVEQLGVSGQPLVWVVDVLPSDTSTWHTSYLWPPECGPVRDLVANHQIPCYRATAIDAEGRRATGEKYCPTNVLGCLGCGPGTGVDFSLLAAGLALGLRRRAPR
jgi:hypothetical protein